MKVYSCKTGAYASWDYICRILILHTQAWDCIRNQNLKLINLMHQSIYLIFHML